MGKTKTGRRIALLLGLSLAVILPLLAFSNWKELRTWYLLRGDFESLGNNAQGYREYRHRPTGIVFVRVPGGTFSMGTSKEEAESVLAEFDYLRKRLEAELPQHEVTLSPFLIAKHEVTRAEWKHVMKKSPSLSKGDTLPVGNLSWEDCQEFCKKTGLSLPTEAQWEYACRAGKTGRFAGTGKLDDMGWWKGDSGGRPHPVGEKQPNDFGLHDMHGNVWEWCADVYDEEFYSKPEATQRDPLCTTGSGGRVIRGGSWSHDTRRCRAAERGAIRDPSSPYPWGGFRPARPLR